MEKCSKCKTDSDFLVNYTDLESKWSFCYFCNTAFDRPIDFIKEFMKDDFGNFPISQISKDMINARKDRAEGNSPWASNPLKVIGLND